MVIFFVGTSTIGPEMKTLWENIRPTVMVMNADEPRAKLAMGSGGIDLAYVFGADRSGPVPKTSQTWVSCYYTIVEANP